tara:strand:+ start:6746 stop:6997 length:252 start_codon:yes stop_codon:yes gene_type:complete
MDKFKDKIIKEWELPFESDPFVPNVVLIKFYKGMLKSTDWMIARHQEEVLVGRDTTLSVEEMQYLGTNRQKIRDVIKKLKTYV